MTHAGAAYLAPSGPRDKMHLHVVIVDKNKHGEVIWVNISTIKKGKYHDSSCEFQGGEHKFISVPSYVAYNFIALITVRHIKNMVKKNYFFKKTDVSPRVLSDIRDGLYKTDEAPRGIKNSYLNWPDE